MDRVRLTAEDGHTTAYAVIDDPDGLTYLANQGTIVFHTLLARARAPMRPTEIVFDLDPSSEDLAPVRAAAARLRDVLTDLGHQPRVKSSGSRGLHIHVTVDEANTFEETREFAYRVADTVIAGSDDRFTRAQRIAARHGRLFIDTLRNARAAHVVAPYSLRPLPEAPIAVPLHWAEALDPQFHPRRITIANIFRRLGHTDDPWSGSPAPGPSIHEGVEMLASR